MAFVTRYHHRSTSHHIGDRLDAYILQDEWQGGTTELTLAGQSGGIVRSTGAAGGDVDALVLETIARLVVLAPDPTFMKEITEQPEGTFRMALYRDNKLTFVGPVRPGLGARERSANAPYAIEASTGLHLLGGIAYPHFTTDFLRNRNLIQTLAEAIKPISAGQHFRVLARGIVWNGHIGQDPVDYLYPDQSAFGNVQDDLPASCLDVVKAVCASLNMQLRQVAGRWQLDQLYDHSRYEATDSPTAYLYDQNGQFVDVETIERQRLICGSDGGVRLFVPSGEVGTLVDWQAIQVPDAKDFSMIGRSAQQEQKPATGTIERIYQHDKAGIFLLSNGGMEIEGTNNQPKHWSSSANSRTRRNAGLSRRFDERDAEEPSSYHYELDAYYQDTPIPGDSSFLPGGLWYVQTDTGNWIAGLDNTVRLHFSARVIPIQGLPVVSNPSSRTIFVRIEAGGFSWMIDGQSWTSGNAWNVVRVDLNAWNDIALDIDIRTLPASGAARVYISGLVEEYASSRIDEPAQPRPDVPADWNHDIRAIWIDRVFLEVLGTQGDGDDAEPSATVDYYTLTSGDHRTEVSTLATRLGAPGPTTFHRTFLTDQAQEPVDDWLLAGTSVGAEARTLNDVAAESTVRMMRRQRHAQTMTFQGNTDFVDQDRFLFIETDGEDVQYVPMRYDADDIADRWSGQYVALRDDGQTGLSREVQLRNWATFASNRGGGLLVRQFSDRLLSSLFATAILVTNEVLENGVEYTEIQIQPAPGETFVEGWKITLVNRDTLRLYVLTLTESVNELDTVIKIEPFTFDEIIRSNCPMYPSSDPLTTLILTDAGLKLVVEGSPIGLTAEIVSNAVVDNIAVQGWTYGLLAGAKVLIERNDEELVETTLTQDAPRGVDRIFFDPVTLDVAIGQPIYPGDFVTQAQLQILQDQIDAEVARFEADAIARVAEDVTAALRTTLQVDALVDLQLAKGDIVVATYMASGTRYRLELTEDVLLTSGQTSTLTFSSTLLTVVVGDPVNPATVVSLRIGLDGIIVRAPVFQSSTFDGTLDDDGNLVQGGEGTAGWALNKAGDIYAAGGQLRLDSGLGIVLPLGSNPNLETAKSLTFKDWAVSPTSFDVDLHAFFASIVGAVTQIHANSFRLETSSHSPVSDAQTGFFVDGVKIGEGGAAEPSTRLYIIDDTPSERDAFEMAWDGPETVWLRALNDAKLTNITSDRISIGAQAGTLGLAAIAGLLTAVAQSIRLETTTGSIVAESGDEVDIQGPGAVNLQSTGGALDLLAQTTAQLLAQTGNLTLRAVGGNLLILADAGTIAIDTPGAANLTAGNGVILSGGNASANLNGDSVTIRSTGKAINIYIAEGEGMYRWDDVPTIGEVPRPIGGTLFLSQAPTAADGLVGDWAVVNNDLYFKTGATTWRFVTTMT